jgi:uncharacterized protein YecT (DUF1311 family)
MFSLLFSVALAAAPAQDSSNQSHWADKEEAQCFDTAMTQPAMTGCADAAFRRSAARLNAQWAKTAAAYKRVDQFNKQIDQQASAFDNLLQGQRAWLTYRDATCRAQGLTNAGGTIASMNEILCRASMTDLRTKELFDLSRNPNNPDDAL